MTRLIIVLVIFFGLLFYFQAPLSNVPAQFSELHSPYVQAFKTMFSDIIHATSSAVIGGYRNYIPGMAGTSSSSWGQPAASSTSATSSSGSSSSQGGGTSATASGATTAGASINNQGALLPVTSNEGAGTLSALGIIYDTNSERAKMNLPNLSKNEKLTASAEAKLQDMFQNQYFAHVSPSGENVSNVVIRAGYDYIVVGENLALGLFPSDASVVAAWMASPGHKKNILDSRYQEIGIAVGTGVYQGRKQWLIVQHFGKPLSACPSPSASLKKDITEESENLSVLEQRISTAKADVDSSAGTSEYSAKVDAYNALVTAYNEARESLKGRLETYNASVRDFNDCIGSES